MLVRLPFIYDHEHSASICGLNPDVPFLIVSIRLAVLFAHEFFDRGFHCYWFDEEWDYVYGINP